MCDQIIYESQNNKKNKIQILKIFNGKWDYRIKNESDELWTYSHPFTKREPCGVSKSLTVQINLLRIFFLQELINCSITLYLVTINLSYGRI
jgi:hypothetical protein